MRRTAGAAVLALVLMPHGAIAQSRPSSAVAARTRTPLVLLSVNGIHQGGTPDFSTSIASDVFVPDPESTTIATTYTGTGTAGLDVGFAIRVWRGLTLGATVTRIRSDADAPITVRVPYPFAFDSYREAIGIAPALQRDELALHGQAGVLVPVTPRLHVLAAAGPTFVRARQMLVSDADIAYEYPYEVATFRAAVVSARADSDLGFNAGVDVAFMFTERIGAGAVLRFTRATIDTAVAGTKLSYRAGGLHLGGGIRVTIGR